MRGAPVQNKRKSVQTVSKRHHPHPHRMRIRHANGRITSSASLCSFSSSSSLLVLRLLGLLSTASLLAVVSTRKRLRRQ